MKLRTETLYVWDPTASMNKREALQHIEREWLFMIMRGDTAQETLDTCEALIEGGAVLVEVAFTTPNVQEVMGQLRSRHGDRIVLAAGTVRTVEQAKMAIDCGVQVIVSADLYAPVVETALMDGDHGFGHVTTLDAVDLAVEIAREAGIGMVGISNSNHCGALSFFVYRAIEQGMIGVALTQTNMGVAPFGGRKPFCGTNPICVGS